MATLEVTGLGISFGGLRAVDDLTMSIEKGGLVGLIGPNGAGKTTVFNMLTGVYRPTDGGIRLNGENLIGKKPYEINRMGVARTFQNIRLFPQQSVLDNVMTGLNNQVQYSLAESLLHVGSYHKKEKEMTKRSMEILRVFGLEDSAQTLASNLPYGKQRRLEIARALATKPELLLLDEPAAGMNPNETGELMDTIRLVRKEYQVTILLIEHDMKLVSGICEYLYVLNFGRLLAEGTPKEVLTEGLGDIIGIPWDMFVERPSKVMEAMRADNYWRAVEEVVPTAVSNGMKAWRLATEGQKTLKGRDINDPGEQGARKLSSGEAFGKLLGFQPVSATRSYDAYTASKHSDSVRADKADEVATIMVKALDAGDSAEMVRARKVLKDWNLKMEEEGKPHMRILMKDVQKRVTQRRRKARMTPKARQRGEAFQSVWG